MSYEDYLSEQDRNKAQFVKNLLKRLRTSSTSPPKRMEDSLSPKELEKRKIAQALFLSPTRGSSRLDGNFHRNSTEDREEEEGNLLPNGLTSLSLACNMVACTFSDVNETNGSCTNQIKTNHPMAGTNAPELGKLKLGPHATKEHFPPSGKPFLELKFQNANVMTWLPPLQYSPPHQKLNLFLLSMLNTQNLLGKSQPKRTSSKQNTEFKK